MDAGQLNSRVTLQSRVTTQDTAGGQVETWVDVATVWASIAPATGRELLSAQVLHIDAPRTITLRWQPIFANPQTVAAMRIRYGSRVFDIHSSVNEDEARRWLTLLCSEGMTNG